MSTGAFADATIVFDLDGTLVDTAPDLVRALNEVLDLEGLPHVPAGRVRHMIGQGARVLIERSAAFNNVHYSSDRLDQLTNAFVDFYRADIARFSVPFPGVIEALKELAQEGARLSVCTNKRTELSVLLLEKLGMAELFSAIVGADAVEKRKPNPDHYRAAVNRAGGIVRRSVMVGDSAADVGAAKGAGAPSIVVRFGYADEGEPDKLGADALIDHYSDLIAACGRLLPART
jgi:phosphoglycolate phosphatase